MTPRPQLLSWFSLIATLALFVILGTPAHAGPRTTPGPCGSVLPSGSEEIGTNRYRLRYKRSIAKVLKVYRKYFGRKSPNVEVYRLFSLSHVSAYHLKSLNPRTRWAGLNIVHYYKRKNALQIYVICRSK